MGLLRSPAGASSLATRGSVLGRSICFIHAVSTQPRQNIPIQHAHPAVVVAMDLAVLVAQVAAVAVGDGVAVAGVADVDGGVELAAHGDLGLHQLWAQALYG